MYFLDFQCFFVIFEFFLKIYQNMGQKLGSNIVIKVVGLREHIPAIFITDMEWNQLVSPWRCHFSSNGRLVATNDLPRQGFLLSLAFLSGSVGESESYYFVKYFFYLKIDKDIIF